LQVELLVILKNDLCYLQLIQTALENKKPCNYLMSG